VESNLRLHEFEANDLSPEHDFDLNKVKLAKFSSDIVETLNLDLNVKKNFGVRKLVHFDETISYNEVESNKFFNLLLKKGGYLNEENNYLVINEKELSENSKATSLRNTRVILLWRGLDLEEVNVKRILSLGLAFLLEGITKAELYFEIRNLIPKGTYEVSVKHKLKTYVLISVEAPVFSP
jgi:hypothetical protein